MKKVLLLFMVTFSLYCKAQDKKVKYGDMILFNKGIAVYEAMHESLDLNNKIAETDTVANKLLFERYKDIKQTLLEQSIKYFDELIKNYPKSSLYFMALNNKAQLEFELNDFETAKESYIKILKSKANDKDLGGIGSALMGEPYANYKNRACERLAEIEYRTGNYEEAIEYLNLTKKYPYLHFCGNAYATQDIYMAKQYAKNYVKLNQKKAALIYLIPHIFNNGLADNTELVSFTVKLFKEEYGVENAKETFDKIKQSLHVKREGKGVNAYDAYYVYYEGKEVNISIPLDAYHPESEIEKKLVQESFDKSDFYKLLNE